MKIIGTFYSDFDFIKLSVQVRFLFTHSLNLVHFEILIQSTLHKSMPHKWIFILVDFFGRARPLPIASNRGQHLTRFLHKSIFDCPSPHKEINVFVHSSRFSNNSMWSVCVVSTWLCAHTLYTPLYLLN